MAKRTHSKHKTFGHVYSQESYGTPQGRLVWLYLDKPKDPPKPKDGQESSSPPRYEATILLPKSDKAVKTFASLVEEVAGEMVELFNKGRSAKIAIEDVFKDGDSETFDKEKYPYYKGCWVLTARNAKNDFAVLNNKGESIEATKPVGGNVGALVILPMITSYGISYKLEAVQLIKDDGVKFGGGSRSIEKIKNALKTLCTIDEDEEDTSVDEDDTEETTEEEVSPKSAKAKKGLAALSNI